MLAIFHFIHASKRAIKVNDVDAIRSWVMNTIPQRIEGT